MKSKLEINLFGEALHSLGDQSLVRTPVADSVTAFFERFIIPKELQVFLMSNSFDKPLKFGHIYFDSVNTMERENCEKQNKSCINEGLLIVGSGLNGDPVVIDIKNLTMGFVFHDELWEKKEIKARGVHVDTNLSLGRFYYDALNKKDIFPVDAYMAEEIYKKP